MIRLGLTTDALTRMRAQAEQLLPGSCIIKAITSTNDGAGGWTESLSTLATVACRMDAMPAKSRTEADGAKESHTTYYTLTVPYDAPVAAGRVVVVDGTTYQIAEVHTAENWPVTRRCRIAVVA